MRWTERESKYGYTDFVWKAITRPPREHARHTHGLVQIRHTARSDVFLVRSSAARGRSRHAAESASARVHRHPAQLALRRIGIAVAPMPSAQAAAAGPSARGSRREVVLYVRRRALSPATSPTSLGHTCCGSGSRATALRDVERMLRSTRGLHFARAR